MTLPWFALYCAVAGAVCMVAWHYRLRTKQSPDVDVAAERVLTLMFIDIVGFSQTAEMQAPPEVFRELRDMLARITAEVVACGGEVDRTLGDGMLCVFGMNGEDVGTAAQSAVACAVKIQREHLLRGLRIATLPLRIGINTAAVYVGSLSAGDTTVIGNGVNLAQRLESACESYKVLIGPTTYSLLLARTDLGVTLRKRLVPVKHAREALEVFEVDPFPKQEGQVHRALTAYWELVGFKRMEERWDLPLGATMHIDTEYGPGELINFSLNGFALRLPQYLGRQLPVSVSLGHDEPALREFLEGVGVEEIVGEVRWARPLPRGDYLHGILIRNLGPSQRQELLTKMLRWVERSERRTA